MEVGDQKLNIVSPESRLAGRLATRLAQPKSITTNLIYGRLNLNLSKVILSSIEYVFDIVYIISVYYALKYNYIYIILIII